MIRELAKDRSSAIWMLLTKEITLNRKREKLETGASALF